MTMSREGTRDHVAEHPVRAVMAPGDPTTAESGDGRPTGTSVHTHKFRAALVALVVLGALALGAAVVLTATGHRSSTSSSNWSQWQPQDGGLTGAQEIADYVSPYYRADPATQLAVVTATNLNDPSNPVHLVLPTQGSSSSLQVLPASSTVAYSLCGLDGKSCAIGVGKPSADRLLLLRREALELALYTFKYISGTQTVVAVLPPGRTATSSCTGICPSPHAATSTQPVDLAVAFDRSELQPWLGHPLRDILPEPLPPTVAEMPKAPEAELVSLLTAHGLFSEQTQQAQDGSTLLVLNPVPPQ